MSKEEWDRYNKSQADWTRYNNDPFFIDDPLCKDGEGKIIMAWCKIKEMKDISKMTYQMLTKWESYTEEQILSLDETPCLISTPDTAHGRGTGGWIKSQNLTGKQKWEVVSNIKGRISLEESHERGLKQQGEKRIKEAKMKAEEKIRFESLRNKKKKAMKQANEKEEEKKQKEAEKIKKEKEISESVENFIQNFVPQTNLEKIHYAQYLQNKQLIGTVSKLIGIVSNMEARLYNM